jgi:ferredoxin--NADP+ reductase
MPGVPFDQQKAVIPSQHGCVEDPETKKIIPGLYCCGWVKRGPVGIVDRTLRDAMDTFYVIKHHMDAGVLKDSSISREEVLT